MTEEKTNKVEKKLYEEFEIPSGITAEVVEEVLIMKKEDKEIRRKIVPLTDVKVEGGKIIISTSRERKTEKRLFGTMRAHVKNMIRGLEEGFNYKLQIANVHFPMNVSIDKNSNEAVVKNFLGEKKDRRIKLVEGVDVKVNNDIIDISCHDIEKAGDVVTRIEKGTRVRNKDRRIFQDGIFLIEKPGRVFL